MHAVARFQFNKWYEDHDEELTRNESETIICWFR